MRDIKTEIINTMKQISDLVDWLILRHSPSEPYQPTMYIDLEGENLCHEGSLSILTLLIDTGIPTIRFCLIDVYSLGSQAFNTIGIKRKTLKDILQDGKIPKVFFDVRNDLDALFAHFGVALHGMEDVQLMKSASRTTTSSRKYLDSLAKCIEQGVLYGSDLTSWKMTKENGARLFKPELGGSYKVFEQRPLPNEIISYCIISLSCGADSGGGPIGGETWLIKKLLNIVVMGPPEPSTPLAARNKVWECGGSLKGRLLR